jgi:hypothetical protein
LIEQKLGQLKMNQNVQDLKNRKQLSSNESLILINPSNDFELLQNDIIFMIRPRKIVTT